LDYNIFGLGISIIATREAKIFYTLAYAYDAATTTHEIFQGR
jgi:hypothetical protein